MEGYVSISNGQNSAEIQTGNGHRLSKSHVTINGQDIDANAKVYDGKTYVQFNFVNELLKLADAKTYTSISPSDISPARSYEKIGVFNLPVWTQVLIIVGVAFVIIALICLFIRIYKKGKK